MLILLFIEANKVLFLGLSMFRYVYHWSPCTYQADNKLQSRCVGGCQAWNEQQAAAIRDKALSSKFLNCIQFS